MRAFVVVAVACLAGPLVRATSQVEENRPSSQEALVARAVELYAGEDSFAAIAFLAGQADALAATEAFGGAMGRLYSDAKDLAGSVALGRAGVQHGLTAALRIQGSDAERAMALRGAAKTIAYDIAANTWPGWGDDGIRVTGSDLQLGLDAARTNLRLARELSKSDLPLSRAHWVLGAHRLAGKRYDQAAESFATAAYHARAAQSRSDELMNDGYGVLVEMLRFPGDEAQRQRLDEIQRQLRPEEDGEFYIQQLETALRVLAS